MTYRGTYNPILQYSYLIIPQTMQIDGGATITNNGYYLYSLFNNKRAIYQPILIETEEERRAKAIKPVSFMNVTGDLDILNAIDELNKITEAV